MTATLFTFANPTDLVLEIPKETLNQAQKRSQSFSNPLARYQAYINELCLGAVLPWILEDWTAPAKIWPSTTATSSFWELVNGTTISIDGYRFVLVPSETIDSSELRVPQEWVDIPEWVGDYYLAVQVEPDEGLVRVWGFTTHAKLKSLAKYEPSDRTYSLDGSQVTDDISILGLVREYCAEEQTRAAIEKLPAISQTQAQNLIARLANPEIILPRLAIPFQTWGALIQHGGWRQSLYQRRLGLPEQYSVVQWLTNGVSQFAQNLGWGNIEMQTASSGARSVPKSVEQTQQKAVVSRQMTIAGQNYELRVIPQIEESNTFWRFELRNAAIGGVIPGGFKLRLLTEDLQSFPNNEDVATKAAEELFVEIALESSEGIVWEIEPLPENYDREILRF